MAKRGDCESLKSRKCARQITAICWKSVLFSNKLRGSKANIWHQSHKLQELFCKLNLKSNLRLVARSASIKFYHFHTCLEESDRKSVSSWRSSICFILDQYLIYVISIIVTSVYQVSGRQKAFSAFSVIFRAFFGGFPHKSCQKFKMLSSVMHEAPAKWKSTKNWFLKVGCHLW